MPSGSRRLRAERTARSPPGSTRITRCRKEEWVKLFRKTFRFTGGEIVGEFLMSLGYLPGAHEQSCPVYRQVLKLDPPWRSAAPSRTAAAKTAVAVKRKHKK